MQDMNVLLFDKLRQLDRQMRMGRRPGNLFPPGKDRFPGMKREIILAILSDFDGDLKVRQKELAEMFHVSPSTLSAMLDKLEEDEYLTREADPDDRRAVCLRLTEKGRARAGEIKAKHVERTSYMFRRLSEEEKRTMLTLLDKMLDADEEDEA